MVNKDNGKKKLKNKEINTKNVRPYKISVLSIFNSFLVKVIFFKKNE